MTEKIFKLEYVINIKSRLALKKVLRLDIKNLKIIYEKNRLLVIL